jgi:predicted unusual protein kinase regulating ubiquinone biosynthesis (AarF/ABC1/UbiB family)
MHADLHPGNIMVEAQHRQKHHLRSAKDEKALALINDPSTQQQTQKDVLSAMDDAMDHIQITLVDAGMVAQLTDNESAAFIGLMSSLGEGDGDEAAAFTLQFSLENSMTEEQRRSFAADMVTLFSERCRGYETGVDVGYVLRGVLGIIRKHRVRIDANFATLVINCLCIESLARRVCPSYNVLDAARPLLQGYRRLKYKNGGTHMKSPLFGVWMSLNALKKKVDDWFFFGREAKRKNVTQRRIAEKIQGDCVFG